MGIRKASRTDKGVRKEGREEELPKRGGSLRERGKEKMRPRGR